jgi:hypothetical protein
MRAPRELRSIQGSISCGRRTDSIGATVLPLQTAPPACIVVISPGEMTAHAKRDS